MSRIGNIAQKAFYLGMGLASVAADKAAHRLSDLRKQAQTLTDELVERGEMSAEEALQFVDNFVKREMERAEAEIKAAEMKAAQEEKSDNPKVGGRSPQKEAPVTITIEAEEENPLNIDAVEGKGNLATTESRPETKTGEGEATPETTGVADTSVADLRDEISRLEAELARLKGHKS